MTNNPTEQAATTLTRMTRVMIVDDHELVREGLRQLINRQPHLEVCGEAASESEAHLLFRELKPDLVIIDLSLQNCSGLDLIKWTQRQQHQAKVIVSTMHDERDYGERSLRAGAVGYVNKHLPARTILLAIARTLEGKLFFDEALTERIMHRVTSATTVVGDSPVASLSDRELSILRLIGTGLTTDQIAQQLHLSPNTIGTYRERLKTKLNLKRAAELSRYATLWAAENE